VLGHLSVHRFVDDAIKRKYVSELLLEFFESLVFMVSLPFSSA
jgi:hypothetical protein